MRRKRTWKMTSNVNGKKENEIISWKVNGNKGVKGT